MRMSDQHLDDLLRDLGDHGLEPDGTAAVDRIRGRLAHDLAAIEASAGTSDARATGTLAQSGTPAVGRRHRLLVALAAALATAATFTATAAVALTAATGSPVPGFARGDTTNVFPDAGTTRITAVRSADPSGGPSWAVRVGRTADGLVCVGAGQVATGGAFGVRGLDDRFREVPPFGNDVCGPAPRAGRPLVQLRGFSGPGSRSSTGATSVVFGSGGPGLRDVRIATAAGAPRTAPVGDSGTFVLAVAGLPEGAAPRVLLRWDDGAERTMRLGRNSSLPDPEGRVGWAAATTYAGPEGCATVSVLRVQDRGGAQVCGPLTGRQATIVPVRAMHGVGRRLALLIRRDDGDRVAVRLRGRDVPLVTVRMAGRLRPVTERVLQRDRTGRRRMVERAIQLPGAGPTASVAILPAAARIEDLQVDALRDGRTRSVPLDQARAARPASTTNAYPTGGR